MISFIARASLRKFAFLWFFTVSLFAFKGVSARVDISHLGPCADFESKKNDAREAFLGFYFDLVKRGHFSSSEKNLLPYANNLIISADLDSFFSENGPIILALIEWLQRDDSISSRFLLHKINKYFHLELHSFVSQHMEMSRRERAELIGTLHKLYRYKEKKETSAEAKSDNYRYPFQPILSKIAIAAYMVSKSRNPLSLERYVPAYDYAERRESVTYYFEKLRNEIFTINNGLSDPLDKDLVDRMMLLFEAYTVEDPPVRGSKLKRAIFITIIALGIGGVVAYIADKGGFSLLRDRLKALAKAVGDGLADSIVERLKVDAADLGAEFVKGASRDKEGMAEAVENLIKTAAKTVKETGLVEEAGEKLIDGAVATLGKEDTRAAIGVAVTTAADALGESGVAAKIGDEMIDSALSALEKPVDAGSLSDHASDSKGPVAERDSKDDDSVDGRSSRRKKPRRRRKARKGVALGGAIVRKVAAESQPGPKTRADRVGELLVRGATAEGERHIPELVDAAVTGVRKRSRLARVLTNGSSTGAKAPSQKGSRFARVWSSVSGAWGRLWGTESTDSGEGARESARTSKKMRRRKSR